MALSEGSIQVFYELSMAIGTSLDMKTMLRRSLSTILRNIGSPAGGVFQLKQDHNGIFRFEQIYSIPRETSQIAEYQAAVGHLPQELDQSQLSSYTQILPLSRTLATGKYLHIADLPDFGAIVFLKRGQDLDPLLVKSLTRIFSRLAGACNACLQNEELIQHRNNLEELMRQKSKEVLAKNRQLLEEIAERKRAEEKMRRSEQGLIETQRIAQLGSWEFDVAGQEIKWSAETFRIAGFDEVRANLTLDEYTATIHPDDLPLLNSALDKTSTDREPYEVELRHRRPDGSYNHTLTRGKPVIKGDQIVKFIGSVIDITELRQAEQALRRSEESLSEAQRIAHIGNWTWDICSDALYWSDEIYRIFGFRPQEFGATYEAFQSYIHPDDRDRVQAAVDASLVDGEPYNIDHRIVLADGTERRVHEQGQVTFDRDGTPMRMVGTVQDITERKEAELQLEKAKQAAEQANLAKSMFLANMSHEIRTPLNAILGLTSLVMKTELSERQQAQLGKVRSAARLLSDLIKDILDLSKIEAGHLDLRAVYFNLDAVLEDLASVVGTRAQEKGLVLRFETAPSAPRILGGDPLRLGQVLLNLANNAIKFTDSGEIVISTEVVEMDEDRVTLSFSVSDTGIGIAEAHLPDLFEPFTQVDPSTTRRYGGTGLGLAISKRLVRLMRGEIRVESEQGEGSTFTFTASFGRPADHEAAGLELAAAELRGLSERSDLRDQQLPSGGETWSGACLRVLLVEDNEINREVAQEMMTVAGLSVTTAENGVEALQVLGERRFDAVLMDVQMPEMDGIDATRAIRADQRHRALPIIAMTAHAMEGDRERCLESGMNDYVTKPIEEYELLGMLNKWLPVAPGPAPVRVEGDADGVGLPFELPGVDVAGGLRRASGNRKLFKELLLDLCEELETVSGRLRGAIEDRDTGTALDTLHTLKGTSATLGADGVAEAAASFERALVESLDWGQAADDLDREMALVLGCAEVLETVPSVPTRPAAESTSIDASQVQPLLGELQHLLNDNNMRASAVFEEVRAAIAGSGLDAEIGSLGRSLKKLDFESASRTLELIARKLRD